MRMLRVFASVSASVLLFGTAPTGTSAASGGQANDKSEVEEACSTDANTAKIGKMRLRNAATPALLASVPAAFVLDDVLEDTVEASSMAIYDTFAELPRLIMDEATRIASSGMDNSIAPTAVIPFQEVTTGLAVGFHEARHDQGEEYRWTRFEQWAPTPPDQFLGQFFNALLYVAHVINADHVRALLYGRKLGRYRRRRYRRSNPNSRRNRRRRRISRMKADIDRMLAGAWSQMIWVGSPFSGHEQDDRVETRGASPLRSISAAAPVPPVPAVPVAHWPPMADSNVNFTPAPPLAVLTPLETLPAPWPPVSPFPPVAAFGVDIPLELPVRPLPPALPMVPLNRAPDAAIVLRPFPPAAALGAAIPMEIAVAPLPPAVLPMERLNWAPDGAMVLYRPFPPAAALGAAIPRERPAAPLPPVLPRVPLNREFDGAMVLRRPFPPAAALGAAIPMEIRVAPLPPALPVAPLNRMPDGAMVPRRPFPPAAALGAAIQLELPVAPLPPVVLPMVPLNWAPEVAMVLRRPFPPAAALGAVIPPELPVPPLPPVVLPMARLNRAPDAVMVLRPFPPAAALGAAIPLELPVAPLPPVLPAGPLNWVPNAAMDLHPFPPAAALEVEIPLELPGAPLPPALPMAPLNRAPDLAMVLPLDGVDWSSVAKTFAVMDLHESDSMVVPERGWGEAIKADVDRLSVDACPSERVAVQWILTEAAELYPFTGYAQGSEHAALAIYRGMRGDKDSALRVFVQWASPTAWFQRSTIDGRPVQLEKGMRHSWKVLRKQSPAAHTWLGDETMTALYAEMFLSAVCSLCTRQGLPSHVVHRLIQKTLEAGNNGPAVSLWVVHSLLAIAEADCKRKMDATPDICIRTRIFSAGEAITSFEDLQRHAPMPLSSFVNGYAAAVFGTVRLF